MSEAQVLELINMHTSNSFNGFAVFLTLLFGYMTVAYIVGTRLTLFQVITITLLYLFAQVSLMFSLVNETHSVELLVSSYPNFNYSPIMAYPWVIATALTESGAIIISLMFMFDIRRKKHMKKVEKI